MLRFPLEGLPAEYPVDTLDPVDWAMGVDRAIDAGATARLVDDMRVICGACVAKPAVVAVWYYLYEGDLWCWPALATCRQFDDVIIDNEGYPGWVLLADIPPGWEEQFAGIDWRYRTRDESGWFRHGVHEPLFDTLVDAMLPVWSEELFVRCLAGEMLAATSIFSIGSRERRRADTGVPRRRNYRLQMTVHVGRVK